MTNNEPLDFEVEPEVVEPTPAKRPVKQRDYRAIDRRLLTALRTEVERGKLDPKGIELTPQTLRQILARRIIESELGTRRLPPVILSQFVSLFVALSKSLDAEWQEIPQTGTKGSKRDRTATDARKAATTPTTSLAVDAEMQEVLRIERERRAQPNVPTKPSIDPDLARAADEARKRAGIL